MDAVAAGDGEAVGGWMVAEGRANIKCGAVVCQPADRTRCARDQGRRLRGFRRRVGCTIL